MTTPRLSLEACELSLHLGTRAILQPLSCQIAADEFTAIIGPNGAGKSSLLRCLAGLQAHSGRVLWQGQDVSRMASRERAQRISWLAQNDGGNALDDLQVQDIVMLGRLPHQGLLATARALDAQAVTQALEAVRALPFKNRLFGQLSGGERQKVLLARALAVQASVLLMDEPLNHLDPPHQADWLALARQLARSGHTVVAVLHDVNYALRADSLIIIDGGRLLHHGSTQEPATHRAIERVFDQRLRIVWCEERWLALPL